MTLVDFLGSRWSPTSSMVAGAPGISTSAVFLDLSGGTPATATFFRCLFAVPTLLPLVRREARRGPAPERTHGLSGRPGMSLARRMPRGRHDG